MIRRAYIRVGGPPGSGKTTYIEAVLSTTDRDILAARCIRDDALRQSCDDAGSDAFFMNDLMSDYSEAVIAEGDNPLAYLDLDVFIAPPVGPHEDLLVRRIPVGSSAPLKKEDRNHDGCFGGPRPSRPRAWKRPTARTRMRCAGLSFSVERGIQKE